MVGYIVVKFSPFNGALTLKCQVLYETSKRSSDFTLFEAKGDFVETVFHDMGPDHRLSERES